MKIEIDDNVFSELAKDLKTTPENVVKVFLDHAKDLPHSVLLDALQENSSLDNALEKLMKNAEVAYTFGDIIEKITGDRDYIIGEGDYDLKEGTFWFVVDFLEGDKGEIDSIHLQFGKNSGEIISASIKDLVLDKGVEEYNEQLDEILHEFVDENYTVSFEHEWLEKNWLTFTIQIDTTEILDLPKVADLEKMVQKIKDLIRSHDSRKNLK